MISPMLAKVSLMLVLVPACIAFYGEESNVINLTSENWHLVENSPHLWVVEFYAPWCGHCKQLAPLYERAANKLQHYVMVGAVNAEEEVDLASQYAVQGFPSVKIFPSEPTVNPYTKRTTKIPTDYQGSRTTTGIVKAALAQQPSAVQSLSHTTPPHPGTAMFFSEKEEASPLLKALSVDLKGRLTVGLVAHDDPELVARYGVEAFPAVVVLPFDGSDPVLYSGETKFPALMEFLEQYAAEKPPEEPVKKFEAGRDLVAEIDASKYDQEIGDSEAKDVWVVVEAASRDAEPEGLGKLAMITEGLAHVGIVYCDETPKLCGKGSAPRVSLFPHGHGGVPSDTRYPLTEEGFKAMRQAAGESLPDNRVSRVNDANMDTFFKIALQMPSRSAVMLFSDKTEVPGLIRALSLQFERRVAFGFVSDPSPQLREQFGVKQLPMLMAMIPDMADVQKMAEQGGETQIRLQAAHYDPKHGLNYRGVSAFVTQISQLFPNQEAAEPSGSDPSSKGGDFQSAAQPTGPVPELTHTNFAELCGEQGGLCAIALLDGNPREAETRQAQLEIIKQVRKRKSPSPYRFMWLDGGCYSSLMMALDIPPVDMPTAIVYSPGKQRYARMIGKFDVDKLSTFFGGVMNGRVSTTEMVSFPALEEMDCSTVLREGDEIPPEDDDMDFLAEIIAEEKARKAALEAELKAEAEARKAAEEAETKGKKKSKKKGKKKQNKAEL